MDLGGRLVVRERRRCGLMAHHVLEPTIEQLVHRELVVTNRESSVDLVSYLAEFFPSLGDRLGRDGLSDTLVAIPIERDRSHPQSIAGPLVDRPFAVLSPSCHRDRLLCQQL